MKINKKLVKLSFNKAASNYNSHANIQQIVANNTISLAVKHFNVKKRPIKLLDIGCGTGFLKQFAAERRLNWQFTGLDIAPQMVEIYGDAICQDMEDTKLEAESYDYCVSSLAYQWSSDLGKAFKELHRILKPNGKFAFAVFANGTLDELKQSFAQLDNDQHVLNFPNPLNISMQLNSVGFKNVNFRSEKELEIYPDSLALMRSIKSIGASLKGENNKGYSKAYFAKLNDYYKENFADDGGIYASWQVAYVSGTK